MAGGRRRVWDISRIPRRRIRSLPCGSLPFSVWAVWPRPLHRCAGAADPHGHADGLQRRRRIRPAAQPCLLWTAPMRCGAKMALLHCASTTGSCRRRRYEPTRWLRIPSILTQDRMVENSIPSRIVPTWPKISIASQIGCCLTRHLPNEQLRIGMPQRFIIRTWSIRSCQRSALGWQGVSMILVTRAGTVSSFSSTMAIPSLGWIPPRTNKSSTLTQEQVVKICSFYCAFWKGERHEVN